VVNDTISDMLTRTKCQYGKAPNCSNATKMSLAIASILKEEDLSDS
jgi:hypothetical protein